MAGHHHGFGVGADLFQVFEHLDAGHAGHAQVQDSGIEGAFFQRLERRPAVGADGDLMAQPRQLGAHEFLERLLVVHEQHAQAAVGVESVAAGGSVRRIFGHRFRIPPLCP